MAVNYLVKLFNKIGPNGSPVTLQIGQKVRIKVKGFDFKSHSPAAIQQDKKIHIFSPEKPFTNKTAFQVSNKKIYSQIEKETLIS
jgi:hypothetical protein